MSDYSAASATSTLAFPALGGPVGVGSEEGASYSGGQSADVGGRRPRFDSDADLATNAATARKLRAEFPCFSREVVPSVGGQAVPLVYLDSAATAQKPEAVLASLDENYRFATANVHRAIHSLGEEATRRYESARSRIAGWIGASSRREVVFTRGATEGINLVARSFGDGLERGDEIVLTEMEHHANLVPWQQLAERRGIVLRFVPVKDDGELDLEAYLRLLGKRTRLVAVTAASNVLGTVNPIRIIAEAAHAAGALVLVDAAQSVPRSRTDLGSLDADFLAFSGHKAYGPTGIGVLWAREALLEEMPPFMGGGDMISEVRLDGFEPNELPYKFEAGTPPIAEGAAMEAAVDWIDSVDPDALGAYEAALAGRLVRSLSAISGVRVLGSSPTRAGIVSFVVDGVHSHDLAAYLDRSGVAVRAGHHCAHPLARRFGVVSTVRASFGAYSLPEEADLVAELVERAKEEL